MKNLLLKISIFAILFSSCNMGRQYANYRFGGRSSKNEKLNIPESNSVKDSSIAAFSKNQPELEEMLLKDTFVIQNLPLKSKTITEKEKTEVKESSILLSVNKKSKTSKKSIRKEREVKKLFQATKSPMKDLDSIWTSILFWALIFGLIVFFVSGSWGVGLLTVLLITLAGIVIVGLAIALIVCLVFSFIGYIIKGFYKGQSFKARFLKIQTFLSQRSKNWEWSKLWDALVGIFLIGSLIFTLITAFFFSGLALIDIIFLILIIAAIILISIGIGKLFEAIMPGMSMKKKFSFQNVIAKFLFTKRKSGMKYYGGMTVKEFFWLGLGVIALAIIVMSIIGASDLGWSIIMGLLGIHLAICIMAALVVGFLSLFPGMSLKKK